jgi:chromosome segregation ATPase
MTTTTTPVISVTLPGPSIASSEFEDVYKEIIAVRQEFDAWVEAQKQSIHEKKQRHLKGISEDRETIVSLERHHEELLCKERDLRHNILKAQGDVMTMEQELQELNKTKETMHEKRQTVHKRLQELFGKIQVETQRKNELRMHTSAYILLTETYPIIIVVEQSEQAKEVKKSEASRGIEYFVDRLGLRFIKQKGILGESFHSLYITMLIDSFYVSRELCAIYIHTNRCRRSYA